MNALVLILLLGVLGLAWHWLSNHETRYYFANIGEGTYGTGNKSMFVDEAFADRYLLAKVGSDANHVGVCDAADIPLGVVTDEASAAEDLVNVALLGSTPGSCKMVGGGNITLGDMVVPTANGEVITLPTDAGTYYIVGRALSAGTDGNELEVAPCFPIQRVVSA